MVSPDIGSSGQDVINLQVGDEYDIYLGVMWTRFGTPTQFADSGTEEEFERAVLRYTQGESVRVSLLFCQVPPSLDKFDPDQYKKVIDFKKRAHDLGCLTRDFVDESTLGNAINLVLDDTANKFRLNRSESSFGPDDHGLKLVKSELSTSTEEEVEDRGLFDTLEDFEEHSAQLKLLADEWSGKFEEFQRNLEKATREFNEITKYGRPSIQQIRPILNIITSYLKSFADWSEDSIVNYENVVEMLSNDAFSIVDFSSAMGQNPDDLASARDSILLLCGGITSANEGIVSFISSVENGVKIDKAMNKVNNRIVLVHKRLVEKNRIFHGDMQLCAQKIQSQIGGAQ